MVKSIFCLPMDVSYVKKHSLRKHLQWLIVKIPVAKQGVKDGLLPFGYLI